MIEFDPMARRAVAPVYHPEELSGALRSVVRCSAFDSEAPICVSGSEVAFLPEQRKPLIAPPPFACQTPQPVLSRFSLPLRPPAHICPTPCPAVWRKLCLT